MLKAGIIGAGEASDIHLGSLLGDKRIEVVGVADPREAALDRVARRYGVAVFQHHNDLLDRSDIVFICVPHYLHLPLALEAIGAGKHVVCEKPLAMNAAEAEEMLAAAGRAGVKLFVAENFRYFPEMIKMHELICSREIGRPFLCLSCFIIDEYERMGDPNNWKGTKDKSGGGSIIDQGTHIFDSLHWFFGEVERVSAMGSRLVVATESKEEDTAQVILHFKSGVLANCALTFGARSNAFPQGYDGLACRYDVNGTDGAVSATVGRGLTLARNRTETYFSQADLDSSRSMDWDFVGAVLGKGEPLVTAADGLYAMRIVDACYESIREQRIVSL